MSRTVVIMNPKGGVGKSTLATNVAGYYATQGHKTMLGDVDVQQSAREWLKLRPAQCASIGSWEIEDGKPARPPAGTTHVVLDTPAGLADPMLARCVKIATHILVPVQASMFDLLATKRFVDALLLSADAKQSEASIGVVGMRVDMRTRAFDELTRFLESMGVPTLTHLRNTQNYVQLAARGLTLFDVAPSRVEQDLQQWESLVKAIR
jgi:chromosome partitioning protein